MMNSITFFEEYFDYMDDMTPEQYCQFMTLIRNLRFRDIDTKPEDVSDRDVRMAWRCVRPVIIKSKSNSKDYQKRKQKSESEAIEEPTIDVSELTISKEEPIDFTVTQEDLIEDEPTVNGNLDLYDFAQAVYEGAYGSSYITFERGWENYFNDRDVAKETITRIMDDIGKRTGKIKHITL